MFGDALMRDADNQPAAGGVPHHEPLTTRRDMLLRGGGGFGALALSAMLETSGLSAAGAAPMPVDPMTPKKPHHKPTAKSVIFLFMAGGPSHLDTFDPKPLLNKLAGQPLPKSFKMPVTAMGEYNAPLLASKRKWARHGKSGLWVSDWMPHVATCVDDIAVLRSCWSDGTNHAGGMTQMHTCSTLGGRPSLGAWVNYGLGTENQDLPGFVVMTDTKGDVVGGPRMWGNGFMPAVYQGTRLGLGTSPIANLNPPPGMSESRQSQKLELLSRLNQRHMAARPGQTELDARIRSYELAFRMQASAPEAVDLSQESEATKEMYGLNTKETTVFGTNCLLARRMVERGVRFIQLYSGTGSKWDAHSNIESNHTSYCKQTDQPIAALLKDLKQRGMLEETLVIWGGEFGRTPMSEKGDGRDHNPTGFTMWMAGGGVKGGQALGATDELGLHAVEDPLHVHDIHATILHMLGLNNLELIYRYKGRPETPTIAEGEFYKRVVG
jgi:hypothetical protein